jgi:hypothetical protein
VRSDDRARIARGVPRGGRVDAYDEASWLILRFDAVDDAEQHFNTGLEWASRPEMRFAIDAGRCHQGLTDVAER